ncbi:MAG TPA: PEP/pyruvate-binding domain-containing protein [Polyangia bacterium]|nr:PEP/pyruvate-binding domain-containing protein [Polyangia bacterium]
MLPLDACVGRSDVGGKAETLARMRAAGLTVADGVVVAADERVDAAELGAALARLGGERFAVRSSSTVEDAAGGSAAGVFESVVDVPAAEVRTAIDTVRASADAPAVTAYLEARGLVRAAVRVAVLIQPMVPAECYGVAHSGDAFAVEERAPGEPEWGDVRARRVARDDAGALATGMRALEAIVGGPVDAEFARTADAITWLQARPLVAAARVTAAATLAERGRWRLDAEHNPDPLSTAQASLVAFADGLGVGARLRVVDRYLYVEDGAARAQTKIPLAELRRRFDGEIAPDCARALDAAAADGSLDAALTAYAHVYRRYYGEVSPSVGAARKALAKLGNDALLAGAGGATVERDQLLWELGRGAATLDGYNARFGDHAPSWDVATATDRERPDRVRALATELAAQSTSPRARHDAAVARADAAAAALVLDDAARAELATLRAVLPIAEDDDLVFLRAQAVVRRALFALGGDDAFEATLDEARAGDFSHAAARRRERQAAAARVPPLEFVDGEPRWPTPRALDVLRGAATAGQARGRAVVVRALADAPAALPPDAVLVVPAIVPSLTPLVAQARALVTDHGGALSHGATLAREYGVPAVLGVGRATAIADGAALWVDGARGRVYVLG